MLFELSASEEITGGAWYTDQELDVPFIESLSEMIYRFIFSKVIQKGKHDFLFMFNFMIKMYHRVFRKIPTAKIQYTLPRIKSIQQLPQYLILSETLI